MGIIPTPDAPCAPTVHPDSFEGEAASLVVASAPPSSGEPLELLEPIDEPEELVEPDELDELDELVEPEEEEPGGGVAPVSSTQSPAVAPVVPFAPTLAGAKIFVPTTLTDGVEKHSSLQVSGDTLGR